MTELGAHSRHATGQLLTGGFFELTSTKLRRTTRKGERSLRRLQILGASAVTKVAARDPSRTNRWLAGMLARKPRMLVTVAVANKIARTVWALMANGGCYRAPAAVA